MADKGGFEGVLGEFIERELAESPVMASTLGAEGYDDHLGDYSAAAFERRADEDAGWLARFEGAAGDLATEQAIDRDLAISSLRGRVLLRDWAGWRRNPDSYLGPGLQGVFTLFLHRLRPDAELAASAAARLRAVPEVLDHGRRNLDPELASPVLVRRALGQAHAGVRYARELVPAEVAESDGRAALAEAGEAAAQAYESFAAFLEDLAERATGSYAIGADRYTALLQQRELLDVDAAELGRRGQAQYDAISAEMSEVTARVRDDRDWAALVADLNRDHPPSPDAMRETYESWTERARQFLIERGLVTLPEGERCSVDPSPPFQRPVLAVASYNSPPPFRPGRHGHFFVPYPPDGTPPEEVQQRLESNSNAEIPTVSVHEAYPGHHWHLVTAKDSGRPVRAMLRSAYFSEGWALYAELMMREQGFFTDPRHELMHLKDRLFRAARIVVDTSLHAGDLTPDDAVRFMMDKVGMPEPTARAEVNRYCAWPTQASSYLTGSLEIERIRRRWFDEERGDLRAFHDGIAGLGCMPVALHERALFASGG